MPITPVVITCASKSLRLKVDMNHVVCRPGMPEEDGPIWAALANMRHIYRALGINAQDRRGCVAPHACASVHVGVGHHGVTLFQPRERTRTPPIRLSLTYKNDEMTLHLHHESGSTTITPCLYNPLSELREGPDQPTPLTTFDEATHLIAHSTEGLAPFALERQQHWSVVAGILDALCTQPNPTLPDTAILGLLGTLAVHHHRDPSARWQFHTAKEAHLFFSHLLTNGDLSHPNSFLALPPLHGLVTRADPRYLAIGRSMAHTIPSLHPSLAKSTANALAEANHTFPPFSGLIEADPSAHARLAHKAALDRVQAILAHHA